MSRKRFSKAGGSLPRPNFFWRGLLIVLPVIALSVFGLLSLRQDRKLLENEMRERAQTYVDESVLKLWQRLSTPSIAESPTKLREAHFQISMRGELLDPAPYSMVPASSDLDRRFLTPDQAELWRRIESAQAPDSLATVRVEDLRQFLSMTVKEDYQALAHFRLGLLLSPQDPTQAIREFQTVVERFPASRGETGLPLFPLAMMRIIELCQTIKTNQGFQLEPMLDQLGAQVVRQPSVMTPITLAWMSQVEQAHFTNDSITANWKRQWQQQEHERRLFQSACTALRLMPQEFASELARQMPTDGVATNRNSPWPVIFWFHYPNASNDVSWEGTSSITSSPSDILSPIQDDLWLAIQHEKVTNGSWHYVCRPSSQLSMILQQLERDEKSLPAYIGVFYTIAGRNYGGRHWNLFVSKQHSKTDPDAAPFSTSAQPRQYPIHQLRETPLPRHVLAAATHRTDQGHPLITLTTAVLEPSALYARQRQRVIWFGGLIVVSALAALLGLMAAWSAFRHQEQLYQMQNNFVSSVTHELRAPIGAVRLMAENLKRGKIQDPSEQQQFHDYIVQECVRLTAMIENVLNLARIEQGRQEYEFEPADVLSLVSNTIKLLEPNARELEVTLQFRVEPVFQTDRNAVSAPGVVELVCDAHAFQRALINLLDNALKHAPPHTTVIVGITKQDPPTTTIGREDRKYPTVLQISVQDQGPGIPKEEQEKIFERFYRLGSELRRETSGVGIGLSIVRHIMEAHHGRVWVESKPGHGSRFILELPLIKT